MEIRIVVVDDHLLFLEGLSCILSRESDIAIAGKASCARTAIDTVRRVSPHVVVMDVSMPGLSGIEATRQIVAENRKTKVLCLSMHGDHEFVAAALERGASGYLKKDCAPDELFRAIRCVALGQTYLSPAVAGAVVDRLTSSVPKSVQSQRALTGREMEVLQLIVEGYRTGEIATRLHVSPKTVATHRANLMDKLDVRSVAHLTRYALRHRLVSVSAD